MSDEFNSVQLDEKVYYINNFDTLKINTIDASNSPNNFLGIWTKGSSGEKINFGITGGPNKIYNLSSFDNLINGGDINSETAFFDSIRETTGAPEIGPFVKAGRQTSWTSDKLPGMENLFNPFIAFGGGDGQAFLMASRQNQRVVVGAGTTDGFSWSRELATLDTNGHLNVTSINCKTTIEIPRISNIDGTNNYIEFYTKNDDGVPVLWGLRNTLDQGIFDLAKFIGREEADGRYLVKANTKVVGTTLVIS